MLLAIHILMTIFCLFFGIIFRKGKGASIITGYSTADEKKKGKIDKNAMLKKCSKIMFSVSFSFFLLCLNDISSNNYVFLCAILLLLITGIYSTIYIVATFACKK